MAAVFDIFQLTVPKTAPQLMKYHSESQRKSHGLSVRIMHESNVYNLQYTRYGEDQIEKLGTSPVL